MSAKTDTLENAITLLLRAHAAMEMLPGTQNRVAVDRAFARLLQLSAPRIRHFIARYGLTDMVEDAEQVCAVAIHRAALAYDPSRSRFTTFVNWQLRGELQGLRFRVRTDSRGSARRVSAATLSFETLAAADGTPFEQLIRDDEAEDRTARGAADLMAERAADRLLDQWLARRRAMAVERAWARAGKRRRSGVKLADLPKFTRCRPGTVDPVDLERIEAKLAHERCVVRDFLCGRTVDAPQLERSREQERPILRRALKEIGAVVLDGQPLGLPPSVQRH